MQSYLLLSFIRRLNSTGGQGKCDSKLEIAILYFFKSFKRIYMMDTVNGGTSIGMGLVPGGIHCSHDLHRNVETDIAGSVEMSSLLSALTCTKPSLSCLFTPPPRYPIGSPAHPLLSLALSYPDEQGGSEKDASLEISSVRNDDVFSLLASWH